ncbi:MAG: filamentous hemagglutinin N-terminal domain-containing protein [Rubrivivax sp.]
MKPRLLALACALACATAARAGALTDGSVGPVQGLSGAFTVPQALGTVRGTNLFHSFTRFGIGAGESATFTTTDGGLRHVIARVTGGEASVLQGPLALQAAAGSRPDFVLVNPGGVVIAAGARFDLPAGLHLSTAHEIRFADGGRWDTRSATASTLSVAAPESFGFLGPGAALRWSDTPLALAPGARLHLSGGDLTIERSQLLVAGGAAELQAQGQLTLRDAAELSLVNDSDQPAGDLRVRAASLRIDGGGQATGLSSYALAGGRGGALLVDVAGNASFSDGGQAFTATFGAGAGGALSLRAGSLTMDAGGSFAFIGTQSLSPATGDAGALRIALDGAALLTGASQITSQAVAGGAAGTLSLDAAAFTADGLGLGYISGIDSRGAGAVQVRVAGDLRLSGGAAIGSHSHAVHAPQPVQVSAARILLEGGSADTSQIASIGSTDRPSADVLVQATGQIRLGAGGQITSATLGNGGSGNVDVRAPLLVIDGEGSRLNTIVSSSAYGGERGDSGSVTLQAGTLQVLAGAVVASESIAARGNAGRIVLQGDRIRIDSNGSDRTANVRSIAWGAAGNAGTIRVDAAEQLEVADGGAIIAGALGVGSPGEISVRTPSLLVDGRGNGVYFTGIAGDILTNQGAGAAVRVDAGRVLLRDGGSISTSTFTSADAGSVRITADSLRVDGSGTGGATGISATSSGAGRAGDLQISAREIVLTDDALLSTAAFDRGAGGRITIDAGSLQMDRSAIIASATGGSGSAGDVSLRVAGTLQMGGGTAISATTVGAGAGGRVDIAAGTLRAGGVDERNGLGAVIVSRARAGSSGQSGSISIDVRDTLELGPSSSVSIANAAVVADPAARRPGTLGLQAGRVLMQGSEVSAAASGNVDAGSVRIDSAGDLRLVDATVRTSALDGNGGPIAITAAGPVRLQDASITTSVEGARNGNGGDISLRASALVLQTGFVQANTRAPRSRGGDVRVDVGVLLPDGGQAFVGGDRIADFRPGTPGLNVVQAAAPEGVSGQLAVTLPQLDLSGHLAALFVVPIDFGPLGSDLCRVGEGSSLTRSGRGALPERAADPLGLPLR